MWGNAMNQSLFRSGLSLCATCIIVCLVRTDVASAQSAPAKNQFGAGVMNRRTVSPWLSTLDNGNGLGGLNYYNIVTPQRKYQAAAQNLQNEVQGLQSNSRNLTNGGPATTAATPITSGRMPPTGHTIAFGSTNSYFPGGTGGNGGAGGSSRGGGGGGGRR